MLGRFLGGFLAALALSSAALAQATVGGGNGGNPGPAANASDLTACVYNASAPTASSGQQLGFQCDANGNIKISGTISGGNPAASATGAAVPADAGYTGLNFGGNLKGWVGDTNGYGDVNIENTPAITCATCALETGGNLATIATNTGNHAVTNAGTFAVQSQAAATGGATPVSILSANSTNATNVKASAGTLYHISVQNSSTSALAYLIFFNTSSTPTCTGTPYYGPILVPYVGSTGNNGSGVIEDFAVGLSFTTGISYCITTAAAGTGSVAASAVSGGLGYK